MADSSEHVSALLAAAAKGDKSAAEELFPLVYEELHRLASRYMHQERRDHTLQATALINEAFLVLTKQPKRQTRNQCGSDSPAADSEDPLSPDDKTSGFNNLEHFIATAAIVMRRILVNHAKSKQAGKRGGGWSKISFDEISSEFQSRVIDLISLDEALQRLRQLDSTQHRLVELRFFGGMTVEQCARQLGISERAAYYEWAHAKAWLRKQLEG